METPVPAAGAAAFARIPRLVFRADGNSRIGLGHVMRLLALAEMLAPLAAELLFLIRQPDPELVQQLTAAGLVVQKLPLRPLPEEAAELVRQVLRPTDVVVLDGYDFRYEYQNTVRGVVARLVYLDDLHSFPLAADLILNPAGGIILKQYELRQPGARLLSGPAYTPLRAAFRQPQKVTAAPDPNQILVCLGGADPTHQTQRVTAALLDLPSAPQVHAVVGSAYASWDSLQSWAQDQPRLLLHRNLTGEQLAELMRQCGAAVCSASTVSYEYCAAGGGLLFILPVADNQYDIAQYLRQAGLALPYTSASNVLTSPEAARIASQLQEAQRSVFDGLTAERLRQEFTALLPPPPPFYLRPVTAADSDQLLTWTNEPAVRQHSFNPNPVAPADHRQWLAARLADPQALLLLAQDAATGLPAGLIRFAVEGEEATLSYLLDARFRGRGLAALLLLAGTRHVTAQFPQVRSVLGHVQPANVASVKAFERAGFWQLPDKLAEANEVTFCWAAAGSAA
ncbi:UDP-2,4-diacetamido-2,4,6-trideoxy-beta-L-altropyranose hydrolase [Hymenobacter taeanensis]|uniref:UDP-2,4-diacetamido-2,4, 6-trideoxy-beta-L-altropyranose hydrolase n=1 Tax=Hymenobacter taeanensis TaxID=2735321 RepID=A0A6M6BI29_9BACT|nr:MULTISPECIES: UDP-2,4-diacetamido-2,4,6-trideoxy-beta-L-altropyranose hydrolase [Hymenobacter]QJX48251.1 UDP-2,4-diacetamido-2,4,6-trideoxy-beta-L-altropyranose hydrolase [Hymenobacter taeanensis]UOQ82269.1 UDP-2,4-diacetamido-2,4,6-trideoxy-beta-L-altropyranose hydrolase [Hymenobacter sp. 5414T-23]